MARFLLILLFVVECFCSSYHFLNYEIIENLVVRSVEVKNDELGFKIA